MTLENKLKWVIRDILTEITRCPDDSIQDIANEALKSWDTELKVTHRFDVTGNKDIYE